MINDQRAKFAQKFSRINTVQSDDTLDVIANVFTNYTGVIVGSFGAAFLISIIYILLIKNYPKCMVYTLLIMTFLILLAILIYSLYAAIWGLAIATGISILLFALFLYCVRNQIETGIVLLKVASEFIT
jgi:hypothetical protein